eukprot:686931-Alexandrium_andersonii.AAC.1
MFSLTLPKPREELPPLTGVPRAVQAVRPPPPLAGVLARQPLRRIGGRRLAAPPPPRAGGSARQPWRSPRQRR